MALWYPILVLALAYLLFLGLVVEVIPRFIGAFESLGLAIIAPLRWLERIGELAPYWWPIGPVLLVLLAIAWWRSGVAATFQTSSWSLVRLFPWMRSMLSDYESAGFAELMSLLLEHRVAYPQAVMLAAEATGNAAMIDGCPAARRRRRTGRARREGGGDVPTEPSGPCSAGHSRRARNRARWSRSLRNLAPMYRKRGAFQAEKLQLFLPTVLMLCIGGSATLLYGLTLFLPLSTMLTSLATP